MELTKQQEIIKKAMFNHLSSVLNESTQEENLLLARKNFLMNTLTSTEDATDSYAHSLKHVIYALTLGYEPLTQKSLESYVDIGIKSSITSPELEFKDTFDHISSFFVSLTKAQTDEEIVKALTEDKNSLKVSPGKGTQAFCKMQIEKFAPTDELAHNGLDKFTFDPSNNTLTANSRLPHRKEFRVEASVPRPKF